MAHSRLEKIGTIYTRARGLLQAGALNWNDRPVWYDIYEAFPPKEEPHFARPANAVPLKQIFYEEDKIRALLHKNLKSVGVVNLSNNKTKSFTQRFIATYKKVEEQYAGTELEEKIFKEALEMVKKERAENRNQEDEPEMSLKMTFENAKNSDINIKVKDIFKE